MKCNDNPQARDNERVVYTGNEFEDIAEFQCYDGYSFNPNNVDDRLETTTCQADGKWSTVTRKCSSKKYNVVFPFSLFKQYLSIS